MRWKFIQSLTKKKHAPDYTILEKLDPGGFGIVFKAKNNGSGQIIALKKLAKPFEEDKKRRFIKEIQIMQDLKHPNIIEILDFYIGDEDPYYSMPLANCNLSQCANEYRANEKRRNFVFKQILNAIDYAHKKNIIHRDIQPKNILIFNKDDVKVSDFGLGRNLSESTKKITKSGEAFGVTGYIAPELECNFHDAATPQSDIFSIGKILYILLTERPVEFADLTGIEGKYRYIIQRCIDIDPKKRYQSISELSNDFEKIVETIYDPRSQIEKLSESIRSYGLVPQTKIKFFSEIKNIFINYKDDETLYLRTFPTLDDEILKDFKKNNVNEFREIFRIYDHFLDTNLPFTYCDTVAVFYSRVFDLLSDYELNVLIIRRLLILGFTHNRWFVRETLDRILLRIRDVGLVSEIIQIFDENQEETLWSSEAFHINQYHDLLKDKIDTLIREKDIPF